MRRGQKRTGLKHERSGAGDGIERAFLKRKEEKNKFVLPHQKESRKSFHCSLKSVARLKDRNNNKTVCHVGLDDCDLFPVPQQPPKSLHLRAGHVAQLCG